MCSPRGYTAAAPARHLDPNQCYAASYAGAEDLYFTTDSVGHISTISRKEAQQHLKR